MDKIVVAGGGGHAKMIISILRKTGNCNICGYTDPVDKGPILGIEYLGCDEKLDEIIKKDPDCAAVCALGFVRSSDLSRRKQLIQKLDAKKFKQPSIISPYAIINEDVNIGPGTVVMDGVIINPSVTIGRYTMINTCCSVDHDCTIGDFSHIAPGAVLCGCVTVGAGSLIGAGAVVNQNVTIGDNCVIGAGAVVTEDCLEEGTYTGVPAGRIK